MTAAITPAELNERIALRTPPRIVDVRTPAEFETAHIHGSFNLPLAVLKSHTSKVAEQLERDHDLVLVCRSGQRAGQAAELLQRNGVESGRVLRNGISDWERHGFDLERGMQRWDLERQVRLVAGSIVLSAVLGSVAVPRLKWLAAAIGGGLTYAAISDNCAMATALSKLPYNQHAAVDAETVLSQLASTIG